MAAETCREGGREGAIQEARKGRGEGGGGRGVKQIPGFSG